MRRPVQVCTSLLSRARISEGEELEVGGGERRAGRHLGELHLRLAAKAVSIEVDRTARLIVDDPWDCRNLRVRAGFIIPA